MIFWLSFWTVALLVAGVSFACITAVVTVRGVSDLREMFQRLRREDPGAS